MSSKTGTAARTGRPKSAAKRASILDAAGKCFLERGLAATSMDAIAAAAVVSKQTVYSHFASKEDLFQAVIADKCRSYRPTDQGLSDDTPLPEALTGIARRYLDLALDPEVVAMTRQIIAQQGEHPDMVRLYREAGPDRTISPLAALLEASRARGELDFDDAHSVAADFLHETGARFKVEMLMGLRDSVSDCERDAHASRQTRAFLAVYCPKDSP